MYSTGTKEEARRKSTEKSRSPQKARRKIEKMQERFYDTREEKEITSMYIESFFYKPY